MSKRKSISKKARFEIFKRDSFTCQYCGAQAPDVILHVDHIKPVVKNGTNDILNLITSCAGCNFGKGARELTDDAEIKKQQSQLNDLNERRNQLEQLIKWRKGLTDIDRDAMGHVADYWNEKTVNHSVTDTGKAILKSHIKKYGVSSVLDAIDIAADRYFKYGNDGVTVESVDNAFNKIRGICYYRANPDKSNHAGKFSPEAFYIRGILRNRLDYINENIVMFAIMEAENNGVDMDAVKKLSIDCSSWTEFIDAINGYNQQHGGSENG